MTSQFIASIVSKTQKYQTLDKNVLGGVLSINCFQKLLSEAKTNWYSFDNGKLILMDTLSSGNIERSLLTNH